jgi:hypothetical protein
MSMLDPFKLNATLPPFMYNSATSSQYNPPVVSMTYNTNDYLQLMKANQALSTTNLEDVNRAVMSGRPNLTSAMVAKANQFVTAYHTNVRNSYSPQQPSPIIGNERSMSLKSTTQKLMRE